MNLSFIYRGSKPPAKFIAVISWGVRTQLSTSTVTPYLNTIRARVVAKLLSPRCLHILSWSLTGPRSRSAAGFLPGIPQRRPFGCKDTRRGLGPVMWGNVWKLKVEWYNPIRCLQPMVSHVFEDVIQGLTFHKPPVRQLSVEDTRKKGHVLHD